MRKSLFFAAVALLFGSTAFAQEPPTIDLANWMQQIFPLIRDWPLKKVAMPGTHDSAMYKGMLPADYAKNQNLDFAGQLNHGARHFDFRLGYFWSDCNFVRGGFYDPRNGGECWSCPPDFNRTWEPVTAERACSQSWFGPFARATFHGKVKAGWQDATGNAVPCYGNFLSDADYYMYGHGGPAYIVNLRVADVLRDIGGWLQSHPDEIVILRIGGAADRPAPVDARAPSLTQLFYTNLPKERILDPSKEPAPQNLTVAQARGKIILMGDIGYKSDDILADAGWGNIEDPPTAMFTFLDGKFDKLRPQGTTAMDDHKFFAMGAALTPNGAGHGLIPANPQDLAKKFNPLVENHVKNVWKQRALNMVALDYIDISGAAEAIVRANWQVP